MPITDIRSLQWSLSSALSHLHHHASRLSRSEDRVEVLTSLSHVYFQPIFKRIEKEESFAESGILVLSISQLFSWVLQAVSNDPTRYIESIPLIMTL
jgi:hypothetical protein